MWTDYFDSKLGLVAIPSNRTSRHVPPSRQADTHAHIGIGRHGDTFKQRIRVLEFQPTHSRQDGDTVMTLTPIIRRLISPLTLVAACLAAAPAHAENYQSWGVGYGMSYAYLGANIDYRLTPDLYLVAALGTGINEFGLAAGGRYYVLPSLFETARARVSMMYGPYGSVTHTPAGTNSKHEEDFASLALGLGMVMFGDNEGFDFDIYYTDTRSAKRSFDRYNAAGDAVGRDGLDPLSVSIGYRRRFQ
jgi:hypothetical protein